MPTSKKTPATQRSRGTAAKVSAGTRRRRAAAPPKARGASGGITGVARGASLSVGDVVLQHGTDIVGTVCSEIDPGESFMVRFADRNRCTLVMRDGMRKAPSGTVGPGCDAPGC